MFSINYQLARDVNDNHSFRYLIAKFTADFDCLLRKATYFGIPRPIDLLNHRMLVSVIKINDNVAIARIVDKFFVDFLLY